MRSPSSSSSTTTTTPETPSQLPPPPPPPRTHPIDSPFDAQEPTAGLGNGDAPNHPIDDAGDDQGGSGVGEEVGTVVPGLKDLMRDACFAPSADVGDYNE